MKHFFYFSITFYQKLVSPLLKNTLGVQCRFSPTCSEYTKQMIQKHGILKGTGLGLFQLLHCHPFTKERKLFA